jgi:hypothetical protein
MADLRKAMTVVPGHPNPSPIVVVGCHLGASCRIED